jgi:hypothetical protein
MFSLKQRIEENTNKRNISIKWMEPALSIKEAVT